MKSLIFLLLLDYSGSMDQTLEGKTKMENLKTEVRGLLSSGKAEDRSGALVFGADPKDGCSKIDWFEEGNVKLSERLRRLPAGKFGKTPLALGLKKTVEKAIELDNPSILVVTDGADSCGQDPCQALKVADKSLDGKRKLTLHIVGYDLKNDADKLSCLKNLNLKNISVKLMAASGSFDLQKMLKEGQKSQLDLDEENDTESLAGVKGGKVIGSKASKGEKGKNNKSLKPPRPSKDEALIEVTGAPSSAGFVAISSKGIRKEWYGSYIVDLKPGIHKISFKDANNAELSVTMSGGTLTKIPWARLMKFSSGEVAVQIPLLSLKWTASEQTQQIHGEVQEVVTPVNLNGDSLVIPPFPFGEWQVDVVEPVWLKGKLPVQKIKVNLGSKSSINLETIFGSELEWIINPYFQKPTVLKLIKSPGEQYRYLIPEGQKRIPVLKESKVEWLTYN